MCRGVRRVLLASTAAVLLVGCDPTVRATPPIQELSAVEAAVARSQVTGSARTATTMPPGVFPTLRVTGVVDFRHDRSQTLLEIARPDGRASPYVDGISVLRAVREQHGELQPAGDERDEWERAGGTTPGPDNLVGILIEAMSLDRDGRVGTVDFTLPAMRRHGAFSMTFSEYGQAPPVRLPAVGQ
ncbi:MAG TPA: hypothetical protein VNU01_07830 [Egibacteraceae bacterium]|nr:hypothetical protein [Egibacteraceae bacterium]